MYNSLVVIVEIVVVGNEVLMGVVEDTNSRYLCRAVRGMGGSARHIAVVRDDVDAIAEEIKASLKRGAGLILTSGGLGPTDDDMTLAGVAKALERELEINSEAREFVGRRYQRLTAEGHVLSSEMSEARLKMARFPERARAIENPIGAAPAMVLEGDGTRIVSLPGVAAELKALVEGPLQNELREMFGSESYREREIIISCGDESRLTPVLRRVGDLHPGVYIKSRASHFGNDVKFRILISSSAASEEEAERMIDNASTDLAGLLDEEGIKQ